MHATDSISDVPLMSADGPPGSALTRTGRESRDAEDLDGIEAELARHRAINKIVHAMSDCEDAGVSLPSVMREIRHQLYRWGHRQSAEGQMANELETAIDKIFKAL